MTPSHPLDDSDSVATIFGQLWLALLTSCPKHDNPIVVALLRHLEGDSLVFLQVWIFSFQVYSVPQSEQRVTFISSSVNFFSVDLPKLTCKRWEICSESAICYVSSRCRSAAEEFEGKKELTRSWYKKIKSFSTFWFSNRHFPWLCVHSGWLIPRRFAGGFEYFKSSCDVRKKEGDGGRSNCLCIIEMHQL